MPSRRLRCGLLTLTIILISSRASADEVRVMVSGAFTAAYKTLVVDWERSTGHTVTTVYGASMGATPAAIPNRLARGEQADVVILARTALDTLAKSGAVIGGSQIDLARSRIAMAVKAGARVPDISTDARFRQVLVAARSIAYSDSASGVYVSTEMFRKLGVAKLVSGKAHKIEGTPVGEIVARGDAEIGFQQLSELLPVPGITIVGPIPRSVQRVTTFSGGIATATRSRAVARQLLSYLASREASKTIRSTGMDPIGVSSAAKTGTR